MKKICSLILCFIVLFGFWCEAVSTKAYAASYNGTCGENLTWVFDSDTGVLEISGTGKMNNWSVSSKKPWDVHKTDIRKVIINQGVTTIGKYAFGYFTNVKEAEIPDSVTEIGGSAFKYCALYGEINLPDSITNIGDEAFYGCSKIKNIKLSEKLNSMGIRVFTFCDGLESIELPESLVTVGMYAFSYCTSLKTAEIKGNTSFGNGLFYGCSALEYIHISTKTKNINASAFLNTTPYICASSKGCDAEIFAINNGHEFILCNNHENIVRVRGDVDGNGQCDGQDAFLTDLIVKGILSSDDIGEEGYKAADCNLDGVINDLDVEIMIKSGLMIETEFAVTGDSETDNAEPMSTLFDVIVRIFNYIKNMFEIILR